MTVDDLRIAYLDDEVLEYHVTGGELDKNSLLPDPGWYPCEVMGLHKNGNVDIDLTTPKYQAPLHVTVLKRNIPTAFRKPQLQEVGA